MTKLKNLDHLKKLPMYDVSAELKTFTHNLLVPRIIESAPKTFLPIQTLFYTECTKINMAVMFKLIAYKSRSELLS